MKKSSFGRFFRRVVILCFMALCVVPGVADNITTSPVDCNSATLNTATGPATLNAQWQANEIDIDWYSDNVKITNDPNAATTCTYDEVFTLPTPPTKTGYNFAGWRVMNVPSGYTRLEYVESSGTQYIDTGLAYNASKAIVLNITAQSDVTPSANTIAVGFGGSQGQWFGLASGGKWTIGSGGVSTISAANETRNIEITWSGGTQSLKIGGNQIGSRSVTNTTATLNFFGRSNAGTFTGRIYSAKLMVDGVLRNNFIPARNSSNVVGMYDTVSKSFFTNSGSGTFGAGPDL